MQKVTKLPGVTLYDVLLRLGKDETQVHALASNSDRGWQSCIAWSPTELFVDSYNDTQSMVAELEVFTAKQQSEKRLVIGYMSYDFGRKIHVVTSSSHDTQQPALLAASFENWISFDMDGATIHADSQSYIDLVAAILDRPLAETLAFTYNEEPVSLMSREDYGKAYSKVKDYIQAGDAYQVNLTHRFHGRTTLDSRVMFCQLSIGNQAGFQAYIECDKFEILSFSPERFMRIDNGTITTMPIKGTRPRGKTAAQDEALHDDLRDSPKDKAELAMITDLLRNDLGKVSAIGSVKVTEKRVLIAYPSLWHAEATIIGSLHPDISPIAALASAMPGGSITGCPKKRAIEIIDELETYQRGIYTGSIFRTLPDGSLDSNIAIRTIVKQESDIYLSAGGGIVYNSVEENEYQESLDKAKSFMYPRQDITSSSILEEQFGPTKLVILKQSGLERTTQTIAASSGKVLETSQITFIQVGIDRFPTIHAEILAGGSIGKTFQRHGLPFTRRVHSTVRSKSAGTTVELTVLVGPTQTPYATITEKYDPDVVWP